SEGYRDETDIDYGHARAETGYRYGDGRVFAEVQRSDNDYLLPGALLDFQLADDRRQAGSSFNDYTIDASLYRLGVDHQFVEAVVLLDSYGRRDEDVAVAVRYLSLVDSQSLQARVAVTLDPRLVLELGDWRVTVGTDLEDYDYEMAV